MTSALIYLKDNNQRAFLSSLVKYFHLSIKGYENNGKQTLFYFYFDTGENRTDIQQRKYKQDKK